MNELTINKTNSTIVISLNRENVLNALNLNMVRSIFKHINDWNNNDEVSGVLIKGEGKKSFCAGGDIVSVYHSKDKPNSNLSDHFFREEYILNLAISEFNKPWISILNGIAMGGGLGLSVHGSHRIVNNKTKTAMPETAIGLFPDVGGGYFLSRMGYLGLYLALTGRVLDGHETLYVGLGTHFIDEDKIEFVVNQILDKNNYNNEFITNLLNQNKNDNIKYKLNLEKDLEHIKLHFSKHELIDIFTSLENDTSEWAQNTLKILKKKSPTSLYVTMRQLKEAKKLNLKECLSMEFRICQAMMSKSDFYEGVRANLVDKDRNPNWKPNNIYEVRDKLVREYFTSLKDKELFKDE